MKTVLVLLIMSHGVTALLTAQGAGANRSTRSDSAVAARVVGCYELVEGPWRSDPHLAKIETIPRDPIRFELTKNPAPGWPALSEHDHVVYFEVRADSIAAWGRALFTSWIRLSDTKPIILISRPLPMAGFSLRLTPRGADLVGTITAFTDAIPPDGKSEASHAITARRIICRAPHR